ncbi:MAG: YihY/virulence factor BrkB family protein [candidate division Zixibacteria bacterium]|nr:YihY/virulence factor BrkB family protein [candidate division Zixibacteria bacterium]
MKSQSGKVFGEGELHHKALSGPAAASSISRSPASKVAGFFPKLVVNVKDFASHYLGGLYHKFDEHPIFLLSSGLAFSLFVTIVPMVLCAYAVLGMVVEQAAIEGDLSAMIDQAIPYPKYAEATKELLIGRAQAYGEDKKTLGLVGLVSLLFAATTLFSSMRTILNAIHHIRSTESIILSKLRDFKLMFYFLLLILLSITLLPLLNSVIDKAAWLNTGNYTEFKIVDQLVMIVSSVVTLFAAFFLLYFLLPYKRLEKKAIAVSALAAAALLVIAQKAFGFYIQNALSLEDMYGPYVVALIIVTWIYYTGIVFILGAVIGQLYRERCHTGLVHTDSKD